MPARRDKLILADYVSKNCTKNARLDRYAVKIEIYAHTMLFL